MAIRIHQPGRLQTFKPQTVPIPSTSTGGNYTINTAPRSAATSRNAARTANANSLPLTVQRQGFTHPLKPQGYK
jgi:hypothetical protein